MELVKRDSDKKAKRMAVLIAVVVHVIVGIIFWNTGGKAMIQDFVADVIEGQTQAPPPPPPPPIKQLKMTTLQSIKPKFNVTTARVDPKFTPNFKVMSSFDEGVSAPSFVNMAQDVSQTSFKFEMAQVNNVTNNILKDFGIADPLSDGRGTKVVGFGKRMRAKLNLCLARTPGSTKIGEIGTGDNAVVNTKVSWNYIFRKYSSIARARAWLKENTQIQVTENTITLNFDKTFKDWLQNIKKKGALAVDSSSYYLESTSLKKLEHGVESAYLDKINGKRGLVDIVKSAVYSYISKKYDIEDSELLSKDVLIEKIEERNILREWRKRGLMEILYIVNKMTYDHSQFKLFKSIKPIYMFFRKAEALENPLIIICNIIGLEKINSENIEILRTYVRNGGFIWIDDSGVATGNINNQDNLARIFIHSLMSFNEKTALSKLEQQSFNKLSKDDKIAQGIELGEPFPTFAHPTSYIPIRIKRDSPVEIRIFNRLGIPVKQFIWSKKRPMKAGDYVKKSAALAWHCDNNDDEPVESGNYFIQMQSGLYQKTKILHVSNLRMLDEKHPLMSIVHNFRNIPVCTIESGSQYWVTRPYGNAAFGYVLKGRMVILYTEGAGVIAGLGDLDNVVAKKMASRFLNNVIAFCLSDDEGVAVRP